MLPDAKCFHPWQPLWQLAQGNNMRALEPPQTIHLTIDAVSLREEEEDESVTTNRWSDYPATSDPAAHMNVLIKTLITDVTAGHYWDWRKLQLGEPKLAVFIKSRFFFVCYFLTGQGNDNYICMCIYSIYQMQYGACKCQPN